jgi:hypothetical protein
MRNNLNQLIIIGGGSSIKEGIEKDLWNKIKGHFILGTNFSYKFLEATAQCYVDTNFYDKNFEDLKTLPLVIGQGRKIKQKAENTLTISCISKYDRNLKNGIYAANLVGLYSLSLAIYLLDIGEIYLLGYDYGTINNNLDEKNRRISHFYQGKIEHRGIGKCNWYDTIGRSDKDFGVYKEENKIKIYNVSPKSNINIFEKIDYDTFFKKLDNNVYDQESLRTFIKEKLNGKYT